MWLASKVKRVLGGGGGGNKSFEKVPAVANNVDAERGAASSGHDEIAPAHRANAGSFPSDAPTPSKVAVMLFYISCTMCVLGSILLTRSFFMKHEEDKVQVLAFGTGVTITGIVLAVIMNHMNKKEHDKYGIYSHTLT